MIITIILVKVTTGAAYHGIQNHKERISVIGLGASYILEILEKEALKALTLAYEQGINYADLANVRLFRRFIREDAPFRGKGVEKVHNLWV